MVEYVRIDKVNASAAQTENSSIFVNALEGISMQSRGRRGGTRGLRAGLHGRLTSRGLGGLRGGLAGRGASGLRSGLCRRLTGRLHSGPTSRLTGWRDGALGRKSAFAKDVVGRGALGRSDTLLTDL